MGLAAVIFGVCRGNRGLMRLPCFSKFDKLNVACFVIACVHREAWLRTFVAWRRVSHGILPELVVLMVMIGCLRVCVCGNNIEYKEARG